MAPWNEVVARKQVDPYGKPTARKQVDPYGKPTAHAGVATVPRREVLWHLPDGDVTTYGYAADLVVGAPDAPIPSTTGLTDDVVTRSARLWACMGPGRTRRARARAGRYASRCLRGPGRTGAAGRTRP